jgi:hypothetical protein
MVVPGVAVAAVVAVVVAVVVNVYVYTVVNGTTNHGISLYRYNVCSPAISRDF